MGLITSSSKTQADGALSYEGGAKVWTGQQQELPVGPRCPLMVTHTLLGSPTKSSVSASRDLGAGQLPLSLAADHAGQDTPGTGP